LKTVVINDVMYHIVREVTNCNFTAEEQKVQYKCDVILRSSDKEYLARIIPDAEFEMVTSKIDGE